MSQNSNERDPEDPIKMKDDDQPVNINQPVKPCQSFQFFREFFSVKTPSTCHRQCLRVFGLLCRSDVVTLLHLHME